MLRLLIMVIRCIHCAYKDFTGDIVRVTGDSRHNPLLVGDHWSSQSRTQDLRVANVPSRPNICRYVSCEGSKLNSRHARVMRPAAKAANAAHANLSVLQRCSDGQPQNGSMPSTASGSRRLFTAN